MRLTSLLQIESDGHIIAASPSEQWKRQQFDLQVQTSRRPVLTARQSLFCANVSQRRKAIFFEGTFERENLRALGEITEIKSDRVENNRFT